MSRTTANPKEPSLAKGVFGSYVSQNQRDEESDTDELELLRSTDLASSSAIYPGCHEGKAKSAASDARISFDFPSALRRQTASAEVSVSAPEYMQCVDWEGYGQVCEPELQSECNDKEANPNDEEEGDVQEGPKTLAEPLP
eukprot:3853732-Rhodomonas_salina.2